MSKEKTACFTGHRKINDFEYQQLKEMLVKEIEKLILKGVKYFGCGGAIGFDMLAGMTVLELQKKYKNIYLIMVLPCKNQDLYWNKEQREVYNYLLKSSAKVTYESEKFTYDCMYKRNRHLVDYSRYCICYLRNSGSGTEYTVTYAKDKGLEIIYL